MSETDNTYTYVPSVCTYEGQSESAYEKRRTFIANIQIKFMHLLRPYICYICYIHIIKLLKMMLVFLQASTIDIKAICIGFSTC